MKKSVLLLALLSCLPASSQTLTSRVPPWMQPVVVTPRETNVVSSELETLLLKLENLLEKSSTNRAYAPGTPEFMTIAPAAGAGEAAAANGETELAGPAAVLAENLGAVMGQNLGNSLGQSLAVPTFRQVAPPSPEASNAAPNEAAAAANANEQNAGFASVKAPADPFTDLRSVRHALQTLLTVQQELQRTLPLIAKLNAALEEESSPLWTSLSPRAPSAWSSSESSPPSR